jgi:hypothetical protein
MPSVMSHLLVMQFRQMLVLFSEGLNETPQTQQSMLGIKS